MTMTRARACQGKMQLTKAEARATVARLRREGSAAGAMDAYRCRHCAHYHVGHAPRRRGRRR
jgi:hypothetical protein